MESICWVFEISPSQVSKVLWANSDNDLRVRLRLRAGFEQVRLVQHYQSMGAIARQLFGAKEETAPQPQNVHELKQMFNSVFGNGR